jgi:hypothetical protein
MQRVSESVLGVVAAAGLAGGVAANVAWAGTAGTPRLTAWLVTVAAILLLCGCIGMAIKDSWTGVIESARNRVSLSRLQAYAWTVLVLSGFLTAAASNFYLEADMTALSIVIPPQLLAAMGIASASLVAAPALLSLKAVPPAAAAAAAAQGVSAGIHRRADSAAAGWLDIFRGDEQGNCATPDLSKIQQFLITLGLVALYGALLGQMFLNPGGIDQLPPLSENFVWLLGISHAGYLAYKAVPHPAAPDAAPASAPAAAIAAPASAPTAAGARPGRRAR